MSKNIVNLKSGSQVTQGHRERYHSIDCVCFPTERRGWYHFWDSDRLVGCERTGSNPVSVERVQHFKLLGITLSHDISWQAHIDAIITKASSRLFPQNP